MPNFEAPSNQESAEIPVITPEKMADVQKKLDEKVGIGNEAMAKEAEALPAGQKGEILEMNKQISGVASDARNESTMMMGGEVQAMGEKTENKEQKTQIQRAEFNQISDSLKKIESSKYPSESDKKVIEDLKKKKNEIIKSFKDSIEHITLDETTKRIGKRGLKSDDEMTSLMNNYLNISLPLASRDFAMRNNNGGIEIDARGEVGEHNIEILAQKELQFFERFKSTLEENEKLSDDVRNSILAEAALDLAALDSNAIRETFALIPENASKDTIMLEPRPRHFPGKIINFDGTEMTPRQLEETFLEQHEGALIELIVNKVAKEKGLI